MKKSLLVVVLLALAAAGCQSVYYDTMEKMGVHKREILVDRVKEGRDAQVAAKSEFTNALDQFRTIVNFKGGKLEAKYDKLSREYARCGERATDVNKRIEAIENVSGALFAEWRSEIKKYSSPELKRGSQAKYDATRKQCDQTIAAMKRAASRMDPVLAVLRDQVLYLKHNLNAQAIASLGDELASVKTNVDHLIRDMESAIREADAFIQTMQP